MEAGVSGVRGPTVPLLVAKVAKHGTGCVTRQRRTLGAPTVLEITHRRNPVISSVLVVFSCQENNIRAASFRSVRSYVISSEHTLRLKFFC